MAAMQPHALDSAAYDDRIGSPTNVGCGSLESLAQTDGARWINEPERDGLRKIGANLWITPELLTAGRVEEMEYRKKHGVYVVVNEEECKRHQGKPFTLKRVDRLEGDGCRSRLVVREIKRA